VGDLAFLLRSLAMLYLGIDVAKAKLDCSLLLDPASGKRKAKSVANTQTGFVELLQWLHKQDLAPSGIHAILEGTGVYHEQAAMALCDAGVTISIVNPAQIRDFAKGLAIRSKTDGIDSQVLARYGALVQPQVWTPPNPQARVLQALLSRREAVAQDLQRERNRQEKADATDTPELIRQSLADSIAFLQTQLKKLQQDIDDHIDRHPALKDDLVLLNSIPGVGPQVGRHLLSVLHRHHFANAEQLAA
jgi:transposase